jgi:hypothetical protein
MDNSVLEGIPLSDIQYIECINEVQPAYYIVPYITGNKSYTTQIFLSWKQNYFDKIMYSNPMAVCQGQTYEELEEMFKFYVEHNINLIGIAFNSLAYSKNDIEHMMGRVACINNLVEKNLIPENTKLHLLGCQLPQELSYYTETSKSYIYSIDTNNPILCALSNIQYTQQEKGYGISVRPKNIRMQYFVFSVLDITQKQCMLQNIEYFKQMC